MERTHLPLLTWLRAAWHMTNSKTGVSTLSLQPAIGLKHKTAWHLTHKIRTAMAQTRGDRLSGDVEMDEIFIGGKESGGQGAQRVHSNKSTVMVASEEKQVSVRGTARIASGRVRMRRVRDSSVHTIETFIEENIEPGSKILTDALPAYPPAIRRLNDRGLK
jgi:hypothetical protein